MSQQSPPPQPNVVINQQQSGPGCLVRGLWFIFIGWWVGAIITMIGYALCLSVIGLPLGLMMLNRLPQAMTLQPIKVSTNIRQLPDGSIVLEQSQAAQLPMWIRAIYFVLIGWWFSGIWMTIAWLTAAFSFGILLPIAFVMFNLVPLTLTLRR